VAVNSYKGTQGISSAGVSIGTLVGTSVTAQLPKFSNVNLTELSVSAPSGSSADAKVSLTINGVVFSTANGIGSKLSANQTYRLTSAADANQFLEFTTGNTAIDIGTDAKATAVQSALKQAFGAVEGNSALTFQIGSDSTDILSISIGSAKTSNLYGGQNINIKTKEAAAAAGNVIDAALRTVTSLRAQVGAKQSQFNFAAANIQISVQNQDAARGELTDTDIATESTAYATSQVKLQAGISVLAQANQQLQNLLKLIQ
jgi:flagellin